MSPSDIYIHEEERDMVPGETGRARPDTSAKPWASGRVMAARSTWAKVQTLRKPQTGWCAVEERDEVREKQLERKLAALAGKEYLPKDLVEIGRASCRERV